MVDGISVEIKGVKELQSTFKLLDQDMQDILSKAVSQGSAVIENSAKTKVHVLTGNLRRSLREIKKTESPTKVESQVGSSVEYAAAEEFRPGHEYLRPAMDENEAEIEAAIEQSITSRLARYR